MQTFRYPMSALSHVFDNITGATHLRLSVPDSTLTWLSKRSGDGRQHANTGFTREQELLHKQDHRRLFFMLLRILMPDDAHSTIDAAERYDRLKWEHVYKHEFENAARCKNQHDVAFSSLADFVHGESAVLPGHLQKLFDLLAAESAA